ncbi:hypothetical protein ACOME3_002142 [Neoechinorhynchus agilis]
MRFITLYILSRHTGHDFMLSVAEIDWQQCEYSKEFLELYFMPIFDPETFFNLARQLGLLADLPTDDAISTHGLDEAFTSWLKEDGDRALKILHKLLLGFNIVKGDIFDENSNLYLQVRNGELLIPEI